MEIKAETEEFAKMPNLEGTEKTWIESQDTLSKTIQNLLITATR